MTIEQTDDLGAPYGMARGFYWLSAPTAERGGLAGMPCPSEAELARLPGLGIGLVVSLLEGYHESLPLPAGLRRVRLPIADNGAPAEKHLHFVVRLCALMHHLRTSKAAGGGVAVHCLHGRGRTGLLLAAYRAYVAARWPNDPDGRPPTITIPEVNRRLQEIYQAPISALSLEQTRWIAHLPQRLKGATDPRWETGAAAELGWRRWDAAGKGDSGGISWTCEDCEALATSDGTRGEAPFWCPSCGWATGLLLTEDLE